MNVAAFSYASNIFKEYGKMVKNSFQKYHDIPFYLFGENDPCPDKIGYWQYYFGKELSKSYDMVIKMDADNIVCGYMEEIMKGDFDVAASLNDGNLTDTKIYTSTIPPEKYVTCSIVAVKDKRFWDDWEKKTDILGNEMKLYDNDTFNLCFFSGKYKNKILDEQNVLYGSSSRGLWSSFRVDGDTIICNDRIVKVMHRAGGSNKTSLGVKEKGYREVGFSEDVCKRFDYLVS